MKQYYFTHAVYCPVHCFVQYGQGFVLKPFEERDWTQYQALLRRSYKFELTLDLLELPVKSYVLYLQKENDSESGEFSTPPQRLEFGTQDELVTYMLILEQGLRSTLLNSPELLDRYRLTPEQLPPITFEMVQARIDDERSGEAERQRKIRRRIELVEELRSRPNPPEIIVLI